MAYRIMAWFMVFIARYFWHIFSKTLFSSGIVGLSFATLEVFQHFSLEIYSTPLNHSIWLEVHRRFVHVLWGLLLLIDLYESQLQFLRLLDHFLRSQSQSEIVWRKCWKADHLMALGWKAPLNRQVVMLFTQLIQAGINWTMVGHFFTSYYNLTHSRKSLHFHL